MTSRAAKGQLAGRKKGTTTGRKPGGRSQPSLTNLQLKQAITAAATVEPATHYVPVTNPQFAQCSLAIAKLTRSEGRPMRLPFALLPPLP